jgi:carboxyl-terminal processing protease
MTNDLIIAIDDVPVQGLTLDDAVAKMRGLMGTTVKITMAREGVTDPLDFELTRAVIAMRAVRWTMEGGDAEGEGDVAVLRLSPVLRTGLCRHRKSHQGRSMTSARA